MTRTTNFANRLNGEFKRDLRSLWKVMQGSHRPLREKVP